MTRPDLPFDADDVDYRPSRSPMRVIVDGKVMLFRLDVLGEGTIEMAVESDGPKGKLFYRGMRLVGVT